MPPTAYPYADRYRHFHTYGHPHRDFYPYLHSYLHPDRYGYRDPHQNRYLHGDVHSHNNPYRHPLIITVTVGDPYPNPISGPGAISIPVQAPAGSTSPIGPFTPPASGRFTTIKSRSPGNNGLLTWDLLDSWGTPVSNGLYYIRVQVMA